VFCTKCGAALVADAAFCPACGASLMRPALATPGRAAVSVPANVGVAGFSAARGGVMYAGFWLRVVAYLLDKVLLGVALCAVFIPLAIMTGAFAHFQTLVVNHREELNPEAIMAFISLFAMYIAIALAATWLYFAYFESSDWQATPGKRVMSIYVTDMSGQRLTFLHASGRFFSKLITALIPLWIGYIMAGFTERRQALHDMIASTLVVRR
jgi:uncharacterized RDD family membrane protein YckC